MTYIDMNAPGMRRRVALTVLRSRVRLELRTGVLFRGSHIKTAQAWGYDGPRSKKRLLEWLDWELGQEGEE